MTSDILLLPDFSLYCQKTNNINNNHHVDHKEITCLEENCTTINNMLDKKKRFNNGAQLKQKG